MQKHTTSDQVEHTAREKQQNTMLDDDMQSLAKDIETSYDERSNETRERREETQEFMANVATENKEQAAAVRTKLLSYATARRKAQEVWDQLTKVMQAKRKG